MEKKKTCPAMSIIILLCYMYVMFLYWLIGLIVQIAVCVTMLLWKPNYDQFYMTYILAVLWGLGDAANQPLSMGKH